MLSIEQGMNVRLVGEVDMSTAPELYEALQVAGGDGGPVLVDLSELTFIDSSGINAIVRAAVSQNDAGCLILHGERDQVRRVLDLVDIQGSVPNLHRVPHHAVLGSENGSEPTPSRV